jgi:hypothetical protein
MTEPKPRHLTWREKSERVIRQTLASLPAGASLKDRRAALRAAYPFGERAQFPYKMWLKCVRQALGGRN